MLDKVQNIPGRERLPRNFIDNPLPEGKFEGRKRALLQQGNTNY